MDREQVRRFFEALREPGEVYELLALHPKTKQARRATFEFPEVPYEHLETFEALGFDLYASLLSQRAAEAGVYNRVWLDRDAPEGGWPFGVKGADWAWPHAPWPEPTTLVRTSEGPSGIRFQAVWRLTGEGLPESAARAFIKRLADVGLGDSSVADPRRVFRIPGLRNHKRKTVARLLSVSSMPVSLDAFILPESEQGVPSVEALMNGPIAVPASMVLGEWLAGSEEGERARKAYVTARFLRSCGVNFDDARALIVVGAGRCDPPLNESEAMHALRSAYRDRE